MTEQGFIELKPEHVIHLFSAFKLEQAANRHTTERWVGQVERDLQYRDLAISKAIGAGVPKGQVMRFVFGHNSTGGEDWADPND